jgi:hypothetical protein
MTSPEGPNRPGGSPAPPQEPRDRQWHQPLPERIPEPTAVPVALAAGLTLMFWGVVSSYVLLGLGFWIFVVSISYWVRELYGEQ